jgi:type I restriction enzyme S subunit
MRAYDTTKVFYGIGGGIRQSMKFDDLKRLPVALPDEREREVIADHLDGETARIDKLISRKARFIELLAEKRQALITQAVTKGLNSKAKTKDSGVEWLGQVPEHWSVSPIKYVGRIGNGSTPSRENSLYWSETGFPWLNSSVVNQEEVSEAKQFVTELALRECHLPIIEPPAILVGITGQGKTRGMAAPLAFKATINQHLAFIRPEQSRISVEFLLRALQMAYPHLRLDSEGAGSTKGAITCEQLGCFPIPLPPIQEQKEITAHIDNHSSRIDALITKTEHSIALLREHRTSLITAAVTGKIDLREPA